MTKISMSGDKQESGSTTVLFLTLLRIRFLLIMRYKANFLAELLGIYLFFAIIFFGGQEAARQMGVETGSFGSAIEVLVISWFLWTMAQSAYFSISKEITQESRWGTLEQLYISSHGFGKIFGAKIVVNVLISLLTGGVVLALLLVTTGQSLAIDILSVLPITILALVPIVGTGFAFGGLTLVYKKLDSVSHLMQFALIGLVAAPATDYSYINILPLVQGSAMLHETMQNGIRLWQFPILDIILLVATAVAYMIVGYAIFRYCSQLARARGVMGHY